MGCDWNIPSVCLETITFYLYQIKQIKTLLNAAFISSSFSASSDDLVHSTVWESLDTLMNLEKKRNLLVWSLLWCMGVFVHIIKDVFTHLFSLMVCFVSVPWAVLLLMRKVEPKVTAVDGKHLCGHSFLSFSRKLLQETPLSSGDGQQVLLWQNTPQKIPQQQALAKMQVFGHPSSSLVPRVEYFSTNYNGKDILNVLLRFTVFQTSDVFSLYHWRCCLCSVSSFCCLGSRV